MDFNKLTQANQQALQAAQSSAIDRGHQGVDTEHVLLALLQQGDGLIPLRRQQKTVLPAGIGRAVAFARIHDAVNKSSCSRFRPIENLSAVSLKYHRQDRFWYPTAT